MNRSTLCAVLGAAILFAVAWSGTACANVASVAVIRYTGTAFVPRAADITAGVRVRVVNASRRILVLERVTPLGRLLGHLRIPARGAATLRPERLGVEVLYDEGTTAFGGLPIHGVVVHQPRARAGSPDFPIAACAVIAVTDGGGGGVAVSRLHTVTVSAASMTFRPWVMVVHSGTTIGFVNRDDMLHGVTPGAYPVLYDDRGHTRSRRGRFQGFYLYPGGGEGAVTPRVPGLYPYYCPIHATPVAHAYIPCGGYSRMGAWVMGPGGKPGHACRGYGGFPYVMDGWILVEPRDS